MCVARLPVAVLAVTMLAGCASQVHVSSDYDVNARFEEYKTYAWWEPTAAGPAGATRDALLDQQIKNAVSARLDALGLRPSQENPDILLFHSLDVQGTTQVTDMGYTYSRDYSGGGSRDIDSRSGSEGTLHIDIIDAKTDKLVWRGTARKTLNEAKLSTEERTARVNQVVGQILSQYPPAR